MFSKVLIANRGEIAVRIIRALDELGVASVAVYSELDRDAPHVARAGEAYLLGPAEAAKSYLNVERILEVVRESGAEAVHPGYGFLAENAAFARACEQAGVVFIGPPASAIDAMGSKTRARELMQAAGVPIVPGTVEAVATLEDAAKIAGEEIGYPVAVKAAGGGGGKGFRVALKPAELQAAFEGAAREGERFFSDATVYLERYLPNPRHVEVQVLADGHGNTIHLGERDCSIQRRHQKLIEESPAPEWIVDEALRERIGTIAVEAARAVDYRGAGTVEGLLDAENNEYFFLEMNTRVQVEHCVTEMTTGIDIVKAGIRVAAGEALSFSQDDVVLRGHAIECRINAEDASKKFAPAPGRIGAYVEPSGPGVRVDAGPAALRMLLNDVLESPHCQPWRDRGPHHPRARRARGRLRRRLLRARPRRAARRARRRGLPARPGRGGQELPERRADPRGRARVRRRGRPPRLRLSRRERRVRARLRGGGRRVHRPAGERDRRDGLQDPRPRAHAGGRRADRARHRRGRGHRWRTPRRSPPRRSATRSPSRRRAAAAARASASR